jgi:hypothetical protein
MPHWEEIGKTVEFVWKVPPPFDIDDNVLYDEFLCIKQYVNLEKLAEWRSARKSLDEYWMEIISHFLLCLHVTNALTERVFFFMNSLWTSEKTQLSVETLKAVLITRVNFEHTCLDFFKMLCGKRGILKKTPLSQKYQ